MKAVIPVAGQGTRLRPHTHTVPKAMLHVAGKTIIEYILDEVAAVEPEEYIFIVGYLGDKLRSFLEKKLDRPTRFVVQRETLGIAHALREAREYIADGPALIVLGDTIFQADLTGIVRRGISALGVRVVDDPRRFGVVVLDGERVVKMVEKPQTPVSTLAIAGVYYVNDTDLLIQCLNRIVEDDIKTRGEYQLTDALQMMVEANHEIVTFPIEGWFDCGEPAALLETNRALLARVEDVPKRPGSIIIPPVWIDESAAIQNSIIGPNVSVAGGAIVKDSIVRDSLVSEYASVENLILQSSIIGDRAAAQGRPASLNVGDSSQIELA
ncbi:MAG: NTP transferase domain-containing protein [Candidatus Coatesbacteria bacterium]|nr:MAG: NTP transferase domain-containing protein [Candidatus Coatesbacteria bacterium]